MENQTSQPKPINLQTNQESVQPSSNSPTTPPIYQPNQTKPQNYLPGVKQLFGQAWQIYKDRWKTLVIISLLPLLFVLITLPFIIFSPFLTLALGKSFAFVSIAVIGISTVLILLFYMWSPVAQLYAIKDRNEKIGFKTSYGKSRNRVFLYVILAILLTIINIFGFILFVIPGIVFAIWFSLTPYVFVAENTGPIEALKRSKQYVNGKFFEVFYRSLGITLICGLIAIILVLIPIVNLFSGFLIPLTVVVIMTIYWFLLYENLKALNGKTISNPINKTFVILITVVLGIVIICFVTFAGYFVSNLIKNSGKTPKAPTYRQSNQNYNFPVQTTTPTSILTPTTTPISTSTCSISWGNLPSKMSPNTNYTIIITKGTADSPWNDVSVYKDIDQNPNAAREAGLTGDSSGNPSNTYTLSFNSGTTGAHILYFYNNDFVGYGQTSGIGLKTQCSPVLPFTTNSI